MNGYVDDKLRALISVPISATQTAVRSNIPFWIDTAFNGNLVIPRKHIEALGLTEGSGAEAKLATGQIVALDTYDCCLDWFGMTYELQIVASDNEYGLLGTMLLEGRKLEVDYSTKTVSLS